jgi:hypothetical protein
MATKLTVSFVPLKRNVTKIGVRFYPGIETSFIDEEEEFEEEFDFDEFDEFDDFEDEDEDSEDED